MLETFLVNIDRDLSNNEFNSFLKYVTEEKKSRIHKFYHFEDAQRALIGDILARYAICRTLNIRNTDIVLGTNEYGKPLLLYPTNIFFNISHSENWVVCCISDNPVGVDVEIIKPIDFEIAKRFFSKDEYHALLEQQDEARQSYFYRLWTIKESYIKAEGKGLGIPLNSFTVNIEKNCIQIHSGKNEARYSIYHSFLDERSIYAICAFDFENHKKTVFTIRQFYNETISIL